MRKTYKLEDLDCAVCAGKMEDAIKKIKGITFVSVGFMTQRLTLEAADGDFDECLKQAVKTCRRIEPDCRVII